MLLRYDEIGMILFVRFFFLHTCNPGHYEKKNIENSTWNTLDIFCCNKDFNSDNAVELLSSIFNTTNISYQTIKR